ncbi:uncharacterized protein [Coffea arabica]
MASTSGSTNKNGVGVMNVNNKIERAHQMYREGKYQEALVYYTEALSAAKSIPQQIALHSNRAACFLKLHNFKKAAEECTWVLELDHNHTGALMLRAQTLVTLKEYNSALFDVNRLIDLNPSSEVYQNLQARLKTQLSLAPIPEDDAELEEDEDDTELQVDKEVKERKALEECEDGVEQVTEAVVPDEQKAESCGVTARGEVAAQNSAVGKLSEQDSSGWQAIPKPKGHSQLDYSRWDRVADESSEDDDEDSDNDSQPQYRFRVRTVGVRAVK